jgi:DMSO/TMAO reductase YedYZ molybdopterin-dependent catalytic subunit
MSAGSSVGARLHSAVEYRDAVLARPGHDERTASILGVALGVSFTLCFATGLYSHALQHPPSWLPPLVRPVGLYRVTQGLHVASGIAAIPLLFTKLWAVYPKLFTTTARSATALLERVSLVPLVSGSIFTLFTGWANVARWYPWPFFFPRAHYWVAWITFGAMLVHIGAKLTTARDALRRTPAGRTTPVGESDAVVTSTHDGLTRRGVLGFAFGTSAFVSIVTVGQTLQPFRSLVLFGPRRGDHDVQGLPINQTARDAGVTETAVDPSWRLVVEHGGAEVLSLRLDELEALPRREASLPIACVEGWSANARWRGVAVRDLLDRAGLDADHEVEVRSLEQGGLYASSLLAAKAVRDGDTLLALELNGERLHIDHGYPVRLIAPNRPGVLQTKWVTRLVVR